MNIFADWIEITLGYDFVDVLETYEPLFNRLDICIADYQDNFQSYDWDDPETLQTTLKKIILCKAQENGVIPDNWNIDESFEVDDCFCIIIGDKDEDEVYKVQKDFDEWCNIELEIWK